MVRKMAVIGLAYISGLFIASFFSFSFNYLLGAVFAGLGILLYIYFRRDRRSAWGAFFAALGIAFAVYGFYDKAVYGEIISHSGEEVSLTARVVDVAEKSSDSQSYVLSSELSGKSVRISVYTSDFYADYESEITGVFRLYLPENNQYFNQKDYYKSKGIYLCADTVRVDEIKEHKNLIYYARKYSDTLKSRIIKLLPNESGALLIALLTGDRQYLSADLNYSLNALGISHIVCISGFHLSVVAYLILLFTKKLRKAISIPIMLAFCTLYAVFSGFQISCLRAVIMVAVFYTAQLSSRRADTLNSLGLSAFILTVLTPYAARDISLIMSLCGTFGIAVCGPSLNCYLSSKIKSNFLKRTREGFVSVVCASVCTAPAAIFTFGGISPVSAFATMLATPFFSVAVCACIIFALSGGTAGILLKLVSYPLSFLILLFKKISQSDIVYLWINESSVYLWLAVTFCAVVLIAVFFKSWGKILSFLTLSALILLAMLCAEGYNTKDKYKVTMLSNGSDGSVVVQKGSSADIVVFGSGRKNSDNLHSFLSKSDIETVNTLVFREFSESDIASYKDFDAFNIKTVVLPNEYADAAEKYMLFANSLIKTYSELDLNCENYYRIEIRNGYTKLLSENFSMLFAKASSAEEFCNQSFSIAVYYGSTEKELPDISEITYFYSTRQAKTKTNEIYIYKEPTESLLVDSSGNITKRRIGLALN